MLFVLWNYVLVCFQYGWYGTVILHWKRNLNLQSFSIFGYRPDFPAMGHDDGFCHGEADSISSGGGIAGGICPVEPVEQEI